MASHPLKRNNATTPRQNPNGQQQGPAYDSLSRSDNGRGDHHQPAFAAAAMPPGDDDDDDDYDEYSHDELSGGYSDGDYDDLNSEAQEYYNSGASELVTTVR